MERTIKLPAQSWIYQLHPIPADVKLHDQGFEDLWNQHPKDYAIVNVYGEKRTPRWQQGYGRDYLFSKVAHEALPISHPFLIKLLDWSNKHCERFSVDSGIPDNQRKLNGCLVNWYQDGDHYIGAHSDSENDLWPNSPIYSFSFGQERTFRVTKKDKEAFDFETMDIEMPDNSLLVMGGEMQSHFKHAVPKRSVNKCHERRINVTFRMFK